jgi:hypothetical protein
MRITFSLDENLVRRACIRAAAMGTTLNQILRTHLESLAGVGKTEQGTNEFVRLSGQGQSEDGWRFNRDECYEDRIHLPGKHHTDGDPKSRL